MIVVISIDKMKVITQNTTNRRLVNTMLVLLSIFNFYIYYAPASIQKDGKVQSGAFSAESWSFVCSALYLGCTLQLFKVYYFLNRRQKAESVNDDFTVASAINADDDAEQKLNEKEEKSEELEELEIEYRFYEMCFCGFLKEYE